MSVTDKGALLKFLFPFSKRVNRSDDRLKLGNSFSLSFLFFSLEPFSVKCASELKVTAQVVREISGVGTTRITKNVIKIINVIFLSIFDTDQFHNMLLDNMIKHYSVIAFM